MDADARMNYLRSIRDRILVGHRGKRPLIDALADMLTSGMMRKEEAEILALEPVELEEYSFPALTDPKAVHAHVRKRGQSLVKDRAKSETLVSRALALPPIKDQERDTRDQGPPPIDDWRVDLTLPMFTDDKKS